MSDIPEWAQRRADQLEEAEVRSSSLSRVRQAFARYIAEHEEEPVDPLVLALTPLVANAAQFAVKLADELAKRGLQIVEVKP